MGGTDGKVQLLCVGHVGGSGCEAGSTWKAHLVDKTFDLKIQHELRVSFPQTTYHGTDELEGIKPKDYQPGSLFLSGPFDEDTYKAPLLKAVSFDISLENSLKVPLSLQFGQFDLFREWTSNPELGQKKSFGLLRGETSGFNIRRPIGHNSPGPALGIAFGAADTTAVSDEGALSWRFMLGVGDGHKRSGFFGFDKNPDEDLEFYHIGKDGLWKGVYVSAGGGIGYQHGDAFGLAADLTFSPRLNEEDKFTLMTNFNLGFNVGQRFFGALNVAAIDRFDKDNADLLNVRLALAGILTKANWGSLELLATYTHGIKPSDVTVDDEGGLVINDGNTAVIIPGDAEETVLPTVLEERKINHQLASHTFEVGLRAKFDLMEDMTLEPVATIGFIQDDLLGIDPMFIGGLTAFWVYKWK